MIVVGIDPGLYGAIAVVGGERGEILHDVRDMPLWTGPGSRKGGEVCAGNLAGILMHLKRRYPEIGVVAYERVSAAPGQGVSSTFKLGQSMGMVEGVVAAMCLSTMPVAPHVWKAAMRLGSDKNLSRQAAQKAWPADANLFERVKDDGRAEAALIALWAIRSGELIVDGTGQTVLPDSVPVRKKA